MLQSVLIEFPGERQKKIPIQYKRNNNNKEKEEEEEEEMEIKLDKKCSSGLTTSFKKKHRKTLSFAG